MSRKPDWLDFAHQLHKEREEMQDKMPPGVECDLSLNCYSFGSGPRFVLVLTHRDTKLSGYGTGATPAKALAAAKEDMAKNATERAKRPQLVLEPKALPARKGGA